MNTQSIVQQQYLNPASARPRDPVTALVRYVYTVARGLAAVAVCTVMLTVSIWAATNPGFSMYLQAFNWSASFIFLALAFEVRKSSAALLSLATGSTILLLTGLSTRFGLEYALWGTVLMCVWLTVAILKR